MVLPLAIGNVILLVLFVIFWDKFSRLKKSSNDDNETLKSQFQRAEKELEDYKVEISKILAEEKNRTELLKKEISQAKEEITLEKKLRLEAENQVKLATAQTDKIQKEINNHSRLEESFSEISQKIFSEISEDLYQRISSDYREESENNQKLFEQILSQIQNTKMLNSTSAKNIKQDQQVKNLENQNTKEDNNNLASELLLKITNSISQSGHIEGENYFLSSSFDVDKAGLFFCELAFLDEKHCYIFDLKGCEFLSDYTNSSNKSEAQKIMIQKLDRYCAYLSNKKYRSAILKALSSKNINCESDDVVLVVKSDLEIKAIEEINYFEKLENFGIKIATFDEVVDLTS